MSSMFECLRFAPLVCGVGPRQTKFDISETNSGSVPKKGFVNRMSICVHASRFLLLLL